MEYVKWNESWNFWQDKDAFALMWNVPKDAREINLPHDAMIEKAAYAGSPNTGNTGYRDGGNYTYVKNLSVSEADVKKKHILKFDGVYCHALVYVNEQLAGSEANGYSTFYVDVTPYLRVGDNEIRVQVKNAAMTNSRWYSGSGIYRDVYLLTAGTLYLEPDSVQVTTESADEEYAVLSVKNTVVNETSKSKSLYLSTVFQSEHGDSICKETATFFLRSGQRRTITQRVVVSKPTLWTENTPALYTCESSILDEHGVLDAAKDTFGIRTLSLDAARGLRVNGKPVKLRGACIHHDSGVIGAATYEDAHLRQIKLLKEAGFNAVRISHHPAAPALLRACDKLGMYVMDEFSDMWSRGKSNLDYAMDFEKWWETDVALMVKKDYNHPCVVFYSVGNEIPEIGTDAGSKLCADISNLIKTLDPTRYTTAGINGVFSAGNQLGQIVADLSRENQTESKMEGNVNNFMSLMDTKMDQIVVHDVISRRLEMACASLDVAGYNYMAARYEPDTEHYPNRVMVGSETYPPDIARNWALVEKLPSVIGDFTWTGWDYIGEAGVGVPAYKFGEGGFGAQFPCQLAYCGDFDLTGFRRPLSYYREIVFGLRQRPYIAVQDPKHYGQTLTKTPWVMSDTKGAWDYEGYEGKPVIVEVYAAGDEVELLVNGTSLGRKPLERCKAVYETVYQPGTVQAIAYKDGKAPESFTLYTPGSERKLAVKLDYKGEELIYLSVNVEDENGVTVTNSDQLITAQVTGAEMLGFGSGDPKPLINYNEGKTMTWNGRAQMVLRKNGHSLINVTVSLESGVTEVFHCE